MPWIFAACALGALGAGLQHLGIPHTGWISIAGTALLAWVLLRYIFGNGRSGRGSADAGFYAGYSDFSGSDSGGSSDCGGSGDASCGGD